jgi:hypothetical protein
MMACGKEIGEQTRSDDIPASAIEYSPLSNAWRSRSSREAVRLASRNHHDSYRGSRITIAGNGIVNCQKASHPVPFIIVTDKEAIIVVGSFILTATEHDVS